MSRIALAVGFVATMFTAGSSSQTVAAGQDICRLAWFDDRTAGNEYARLSNALEATASHRAAAQADAEATSALLARLAAMPATDLVLKRTAAEKAAFEAARSPALAGLQRELSRYCLVRLERAPRTFTDALSTRAARARQLATLPDDQLTIAFTSDTDQVARELGTPAAAARTIRAVLAGAR